MKYNFYTERSSDGTQWVGRCRELPDVRYERPGRDAALSGVKRLVAKLGVSAASPSVPPPQPQGTQTSDNLASQSPPVTHVTKKKISHVCFVLDASGSMSGLRNNVIQSLRSNIDTLKEESSKSGITMLVSVVQFSYSPSTVLFERDVLTIDDNCFRTVSDLYNPSGQTALFDAVHYASDHMRYYASNGDAEIHTYLVMTMTDGYENYSKISSVDVRARVSELQQTDMWTFAFVTPSGSRYAIERDFGVFPGNITEWVPSSKGVSQYTAQNNAGIRAYTSNVMSGNTRMKSFYANTGNLSNVQVASSLVDVASQCVKIASYGDGVQIRDLCLSKINQFVKGAAFYELKKSEKVQEYKSIILEDVKTGKMYTGANARNLLGIPAGTGTIHLRPGYNPQYRIYVQSTSVNRKLDYGDSVIYFKGQLA